MSYNSFLIVLISTLRKETKSLDSRPKEKCEWFKTRMTCLEKKKSWNIILIRNFISSSAKALESFGTHIPRVKIFTEKAPNKFFINLNSFSYFSNTQRTVLLLKSYNLFKNLFKCYSLSFIWFVVLNMGHNQYPLIQLWILWITKKPEQIISIYTS